MRSGAGSQHVRAANDEVRKPMKPIVTGLAIVVVVGCLTPLRSSAGDRRAHTRDGHHAAAGAAAFHLRVGSEGVRWEVEAPRPMHAQAAV
jgi:hypothetical protein